MGLLSDKVKIENEASISLIPMINFFIAIIPVLLIASSFDDYSSLSANLPAKAQTTESPSTTHAQLAVYLHKDEVSLKLIGNNQKSQKTVYKSVQEIESRLQQLPSFRTAIFRASDETTYRQTLEVIQRLKRSPSIEQVVIANKEDL